MFNASRWDPDWREEEALEEVSLEEALEFVTEPGYECGLITTNMDRDIFANGSLLMSREEAEEIGRKDAEAFEDQLAEMQAKREAEEAEEARLAAEEAKTVGDKIDKENIDFILSIAKGFPARDSGARLVADEIGRISGWRDKRTSWKATEGDVIDTINNREYHIVMWRGQRTVTRTRLHA